MKFFTHRFGGISDTFSKIGHDPEADWYFVMAGFLVGIIVAVGADGLLFLGLNASTATSDGADLSTVTLNRKDITGAIESIGKEDANSTVLPNIVKKDPSKSE